MFVTSSQLWVFPCANRTVNIESKLLTESNFTHVASLAGKSSYVIGESTVNEVTYLEFVISGYYFKIVKTELETVISADTNTYVHLALLSQNLTPDTSIEATTSLGGNTTMIGTITTGTETTIEILSPITDGLDLTDDSSVVTFRGLLIDNEETHDSLSGGDLIDLQIYEGEALTNIGAIGTNQLRDNEVTIDKLANDCQLVSITYDELVNMRDSGTLTAGRQYRITDYTCAVSGNEITSAAHQFDIIVTADSTSKLNESARAILHDGDTYFADCNLSAWELKYCLDNDAGRFEWANSTDGKGVIYYMKDEWDNEAPYDFKNILFYRYCVTVAENTYAYLAVSNDATYVEEQFPSDYTISETKVECYTFSAAEWNNSNAPTVTDLSVSGFNSANGKGTCESNKIATYYTINNTNTSYSKIQVLNNIVLEAWPATDGYTMSCDITNNTIAADCCNITIFGSDNTILSSCYNIVLYDNGKGGRSYNVGRNFFGANCSYIFCGAVNIKNIFETSARSIYLGSNCFDNTFGDTCNNIILADHCYRNTFEKVTAYINVKSTCMQSTVASGCKYINISASDSVSTIGNLQIFPGVAGTSDAYKEVTVSASYSAYEVHAADTAVFTV